MLLQVGLLQSSSGAPRWEGWADFISASVTAPGLLLLLVASFLHSSMEHTSLSRVSLPWAWHHLDAQAWSHAETQGQQRQSPPDLCWARRTR